MSPRTVDHAHPAGGLKNSAKATHHASGQSKTSTGADATSNSSGERARRTEAGYSTVEAVLLLPVLVIATLVVVQFALLWHARELAQAAAESGAETARLYSASDADGIREASTYLRGVDPALLSGTRISAQRNATDVSVRIQGHVLSAAGMPFHFSIDEQASFPIEKFEADDG